MFEYISAVSIPNCTHQWEKQNQGETVEAQTPVMNLKQLWQEWEADFVSVTISCPSAIWPSSQKA